MDASITIAVITALAGGGGIAKLYQINRDYKIQMREMEIRAKEAETNLLAERAEHEKKTQELKEIREPSLQYDPLFLELEDIKYFFIEEFELSDIGRTKLVIEEVCNKVDIWKSSLLEANKEIEDCLDTCDRCSPECTKLEAIHMKYYREANEAYKSWYEGSLPVSVEGQRYTEEDCDTMKVLANAFEAKHKPRENMVSSMIKAISNNKAYGTNCRARAKDINKVYVYAFVEMKLDLVDSAIELNGELTGKKFLTHIVGDSEHH